MSIYDNIAYGLRLHGMKAKGELDAAIERSLRGELKGEAVMDYRPEGLVCRLNARLPEAHEGGVLGQG